MKVKGCIGILLIICCLVVCGCSSSTEADSQKQLNELQKANEALNEQLKEQESENIMTEVELTATPKPTAMPEATATPEPTVTPEPTATPEATATPRPTATPEPTATPKPTATPEATATPEPTATPVPTVTPTDENNMFKINMEGITTTDELETRIEEHLDRCIASLFSRWELLAEEIDTFEKYCENTINVTEFYETVIEETDQMCIMLYEYSAAYARLILDSDLSNEDKYKEVDGINDFIYDDACKIIEDEIYDELLGDMSDHFYEGIIDDASGETDFSKWYDISSKEYSQWYDASSDVYSLYYDAMSDIYSFYFDMSTELYSGDIDRAEKAYERFLKKIDKAKGIGTSENIPAAAKFDTSVRNIATIDDVESTVETHVSECIQLLGKEWTTLSEEINSYDKYLENVNKVEDFHARVEEATDQILVMICEYGISYAELIMQSDLSNKEKYNLFEDVKDCIYEDACETVKDDIYEGLLNDIKDYYYDGIINDARDYVKYSDWSDSRSDAYERWSDARSEVYGDWSDIRGDIYSFWTDVRGELYGGDSDGAIDEIQNFKDKLEKMK